MDRVMGMTWNVMSTERFFDVLEFWIRAPWPMGESDAEVLAADLGWVVGDDKSWVNPVDGLTQQGVRAVGSNVDLETVSFWVTDVVPPGTPEADAFLNDHFTVLVREAKKRWGRPKLTRAATSQRAQWELSGGGRVNITRLNRSVTARFTTPQFAAILRGLGE
jgi:hypothetical protein